MTVESPALRIAQVVSHLRGGGKEQVVVSLANALVEDGLRPMIVCLEMSGLLEQQVRRADIPVEVLPKRAGNDPVVPFRLAALLRRERVDIVHCHNWGTLLESIFAARWAGIRAIVHTQHGLDYQRAASRDGLVQRGRTMMKRVAARWLSGIVAVSGEVKDMIHAEWRVPDDRIRVIHNGVPLGSVALSDAERASRRRALGLAPEDFVIGSAGHMRPVKNFPMLLEALGLALPAAPRARLVLMGDGPLRQEIEETVARLGLERSVLLLGRRADVPDLLLLCDAYALCSFSEGISISILEAMAAGLPVIATRVGGNSEIVVEGETGFLVPVAADRVAAAIVALADNPVLCGRMGASGRARVISNFSLSRMSADYRDVYARVADRPFDAVPTGSAA
jgi:sugar transferase (PEP-CTERM/EpsH1 system associated)